MGMICPSIFTLMGEFEVKNRSLALRSTMSLNKGRVFNTAGADSPPAFASEVSSSCSFTAAIFALFRPARDVLVVSLERPTLLFFVDHGERSAVVEVLHLAL